ncbi:MAG: Arsenate reductase thioredoxin-coupled, partial [uncultured Blastococcus sp.]
ARGPGRQGCRVGPADPRRDRAADPRAARRTPSPGPPGLL